MQETITNTLTAVLTASGTVTATGSVTPTVPINIPLPGNTGLLITSYGVVMAFALVLAVAPALYLRRRFGATWLNFGWGAFVGIVAQFAIGYLVQPLAASVVGGDPSKLQGFNLFLAELVLIAFSAILNIALLYLAYVLILKWIYDRTWANAMMFGAGGLALNAIGSLAFAALQGLSFLLGPPTELPVDQVASYRDFVKSLGTLSGVEPLFSLLSVAAQGAVLFGVAVLVMQTLKGRGWQWAAIALALYAAPNVVASFAGNVLSPNGLLVAGAVNYPLLLGCALVGLYFVRRFFEVEVRDEQREAVQAAANPPRAVEQVMSDIKEEPPAPRNRRRR